jgi:hypothetical protein
MRKLLHSQGRKEHPTYGKKRMANRVGHIMCGNCLLKHIIDGKID